MSTDCKVDSDHFDSNNNNRKEAGFNLGVVQKINRVQVQMDEEVQEDFNAMISLMLISFSLGFRFLFMAIPFIFYAAGAIPLVATTAVMICFLVFIDHPYNLLRWLSTSTSAAAVSRQSIR